MSEMCIGDSKLCIKIGKKKGSKKFAPAPEDAGPRSLVDAQRFARANPDVTAKVIENWIRARGFKK